MSIDATYNTLDSLLYVDIEKQNISRLCIIIRVGSYAEERTFSYPWWVKGCTG